MIQARREHVETMLFFAAVLYSALAAVAYGVGEIREPSAYLGFTFLIALYVSSALILRHFRWEGVVPSYFAALSGFAALSHAYFFFPAATGSIFHVVLCLGMLIAVWDFSVLLRRPAALPLQAAIVALTAARVFSLNGAERLLVGGPVALLLLWKLALAFHFRLGQADREQVRQQEAFRATVVTLNHEFNNVSAICQPLLQKLRALSEAAGGDTEELAMLERGLSRLVKLVKDLRKVERYEEVAYVGKTKMVSLEGEKEGA